MSPEAFFPEKPRRLARRACLALLCVTLAMCPACGSDAEKTAENTAKDHGGMTSPELPRKDHPQKPAVEDLARANAMLDFNNRAVEALSKGPYAQPNKIAAAKDVYLETFRLPKLGKPRGRKAARGDLAPPPGLFTTDEQSALAAALANMDSALDDMLRQYAELERYVRDDTIIDDGKRGRELCRKLGGQHDVFMSARKTWLDIVTSRAREAEKILLEEHPLKRQILAGQDIFELMNRASEQLSAPRPDKGAIAATSQEIAARVAKAAEPPFPAPPAVERAFRHFLRQADAYVRQLERGLAEGFYTPVKRRLNALSAQTRRAYNAFVKSANEPGR